MNENQFLDYLDETGRHPKFLPLFRICLAQVLKELKIEKPVEVSLSIVSSEKSHELNREYRQIDRPTDVLTFAFQEDEGKEEEGVATTKVKVEINGAEEIT